MFKHFFDEAKSKIADNPFSRNIADSLDKTLNLGQEVALDKIMSLVDEFNDALPHLSEAGYTLDQLDVELGLPPKLIPHFVYAQDSEVDSETALENLKNNRLGHNLLKILIMVEDYQHKFKFSQMSFCHLEIELSVIPTVKLAYKTHQPQSHQIA
tara:strand:+ start:195 stop:659 length:465 start_codon:yes stop_codon:yes gene_type:complete